MDRPAFRGLHLATIIDRLAEEVENPAERRRSHRHGKRASAVDDVRTPNEPVGTAKRHASHLSATKVLLHLADQVERYALFLTVDADGVVDRRDAVFGEFDVKGRPNHLRDVSDVPACCLGRRRHDGSCFCDV